MNVDTLPEPHRLKVSFEKGNLEGDLRMPDEKCGLVLFANVDGHDRRNPRNLAVARVMHEAGFATLLIELLYPDETEGDRSCLDSEIDRLSRRLEHVVDWLDAQQELNHLQLGLFGEGAGAASVLLTAARKPSDISAIVCRSGRPDLATEAMSQVCCPTLFIVGDSDQGVLALNRQAIWEMSCPRRLEVIRGATHRFDAPGAMERVAGLAEAWYRRYLQAPVRN